MSTSQSNGMVLAGDTLLSRPFTGGTYLEVILRQCLSYLPGDGAKPGAEYYLPFIDPKPNNHYNTPLQGNIPPTFQFAVQLRQMINRLPARGSRGGRRPRLARRTVADAGVLAGLMCTCHLELQG